MTTDSGRCTHRTSHNVHCRIACLEDSGRFMLEVTVECGTCGAPFRFLGLPLGLHFSGAATSIDGREATLAIHPCGEEQPHHPLQGYSVEMPR